MSTTLVCFGNTNQDARKYATMAKFASDICTHMQSQDEEEHVTHVVFAGDERDGMSSEHFSVWTDWMEKDAEGGGKRLPDSTTSALRSNGHCCVLGRRDIEKLRLVHEVPVVLRPDATDCEVELARQTLARPCTQAEWPLHGRVMSTIFSDSQTEHTMHSINSINANAFAKTAFLINGTFKPPIRGYDTEAHEDMHDGHCICSAVLDTAIDMTSAESETKRWLKDATRRLRLEGGPPSSHEIRCQRAIDDARGKLHQFRKEILEEDELGHRRDAMEQVMNSLHEWIQGGSMGRLLRGEGSTAVEVNAKAQSSESKPWKAVVTRSSVLELLDSEVKGGADRGIGEARELHKQVLSHCLQCEHGKPLTTVQYTLQHADVSAIVAKLAEVGARHPFVCPERPGCLHVLNESLLDGPAPTAHAVIVSDNIEFNTRTEIGIKKRWRSVPNLEMSLEETAERLSHMEACNGCPMSVTVGPEVIDNTDDLDRRARILICKGNGSRDQYLLVAPTLFDSPPPGEDMAEYNSCAESWNDEDMSWQWVDSTGDSAVSANIDYELTWNRTQGPRLVHVGTLIAERVARSPLLHTDKNHAVSDLADDNIWDRRCFAARLQPIDAAALKTLPKNLKQIRPTRLHAHIQTHTLKEQNVMVLGFCSSPHDEWVGRRIGLRKDEMHKWHIDTYWPTLPSAP